MKAYRLILYIVLPVLLLQACNKEDDLSPSYEDVNRLKDSLDLSIPLVKEYYDNYDIYLLNHFNDSLDFKFVFGTNSGWIPGLKLEYLPDAMANYAYKALDEFVLQYFTDQDFIKNNFPKKILLACSAKGSFLSGNLPTTELDNRETTTASALFNGYEQLFAFDSTYLEKSAANKLKSRNAALYAFFATLIQKNNLVSKIPGDFFSYSADLYGTSVNELAIEEAVDTVGSGTRWYYPASWYISKGMVLTKQSPLQSATNADYNKRLITSKSITFPLKERDVRNYLHVIICETSSSSSSPLVKYYKKSDVFVAKLKILVKTLEEWGVDVFKINPAIKEVFYND